MKYSFIRSVVFLVVCWLFIGTEVSAQRPMEKLDRSVVAQKVTGGVYVNWRIPAEEWYNTFYKLYRDGTLIFTTSTSGASNYLDASGTTSSKYTVTSVHNGVESAPSKTPAVLTNGYLEIPMRNIKALGKTGYYLNDCTAADLDGDGQYEVIVKRMNRDWRTTNTNYTFFEAYKLDGTFLWAIDVGPNITMDVEINIAAFDFDGDGKAEVYMRTSEGTVFGDGTKIGDVDGDGTTNYRSSIVWYTDSETGELVCQDFMNAGPEFLSLIDGATGKELDRVNFIARGNSSDWGDSYGHRANKFFFGAPFLDGIHPSIFIGRGIYTQTKMATYDVVNKKLVARWTWESGNSGIYYGQGNHNYTIADTDGDGCDEIVWGSMCVDHDGKGLYSTALGHGDAMHVGDLDPYYKGIEVFACNEANPGLNMRDGKTGKILIRHVTASDCGRACCGNLTDAYKGEELWGGGVGYSATVREQMTHFGVSESYAMYWDGDLLKELCYHSGFTTGTGVGYGQITKFNGYNSISTLLLTDTYSCNYTKGTPCLQADLVGDWREEAIWWRRDSMALRIYVTPYQTTNRIYTMMHDPQYRQAICWQMCGYNQPPHASFYLGSDFPTPIPPKTTNGMLVWKGTTSEWNTTAQNFMVGDSAKALLSGSPVMSVFSDGQKVLFDTHGTNRSINLTGNLKPEVLTVSGTADYDFNGSGTLSDSMRFDKLGEGTVTIEGNHSYTGPTDIWEGSFWNNGILSASPVVVRRHALYGGVGLSGAGISAEFNAGIYVGGLEVADTMTVNGTLKLNQGAKLVFDLSDNPTVKNNPTTSTSAQKNDYLKLNGALSIVSGSIISINQSVDSLLTGTYELASVDSVIGDLSVVQIDGTIGVATSLSFNTVTKKLILEVKGVRDASSIVWSGDNNANWNLAVTPNWLKNGSADIFVADDSVFFKTEATNRTVNLVGTLPVKYMEVNSGLDYTFDGTGSLAGTMNLVKKNAGKLTLNTRNSFTGKTVVEGGTLIMKYAPSATANGGIGTNMTDVSSLTLKDSSILQVVTANEITSRGLTLSGTNGGLMNVAAALYWNGVIQGTKLTKFGNSTLYIGNGNTNLTETVLKAGTIKLNAETAVPYGVGRKITLLGGTLETLNSTGAYLASNHAIEIPYPYAATLIAGARCEYWGALTGAGTLNWYCDFIRCYLNGDWSGFSGNLNIQPNTANDSNYENHFIFNNVNGMPNATINIASGVMFCYKNGTSDNGTATVKLAMLTGVAGSTWYNAGLEVGNSGKSGTFSGVISGVSSIKKLGGGTWTLSGANTYSGTTTLSSGRLNITGAKTGAGAVIAGSGTHLSVTSTLAGTTTLNGFSESMMGARLSGTGTLTGNVTAGDYATLSPADSTAIGTLTFGGNLTFGETIYEAQISGGVSAISDKLAVTGTLTCGGILLVKRLNTTMLVSGQRFQLFSAGTITGAFSLVDLPELTADLDWDQSALYTTGTLSIYKLTAVKNVLMKAGLMQNPTQGHFSVYLENPEDQVRVTVTDLQGRILLEQKVNALGGAFNLDLTERPKGVYLLRIESDERKYQTLKLIKE
jgi:autotransporter-associated beta strand protein